MRSLVQQCAHFLWIPCKNLLPVLSAVNLVRIRPGKLSTRRILIRIARIIHRRRRPSLAAAAVLLIQARCLKLKSIN